VPAPSLERTDGCPKQVRLEVAWRKAERRVLVVEDVRQETTTPGSPANDDTAVPMQLALSLACAAAAVGSRQTDPSAYTGRPAASASIVSLSSTPKKRVTSSS